MYNVLRYKILKKISIVIRSATVVLQARKKLHQNRQIWDFTTGEQARWYRMIPLITKC